MGSGRRDRVPSGGPAFRRTFALLALLAVGCREELGPVPFKTTRVRGIVRVGKEPVKGGWVEIFPIRGTVGNMRTAPIGPDGSFEADRVAVGKNAVGILNAPIDPGLLAQFHPFHEQPIQRDIPEGGSSRVEIDLLEELFRRANPRGNDRDSFRFRE